MRECQLYSFCQCKKWSDTYVKANTIWWIVFLLRLFRNTQTWLRCVPIFFLGCRCSSLLAFVRFACFLVLFRLICFVNVICASCIHQHQRDTTKTAQFYRKHKYKTRESTNNAEKVNQHFLFRTKNKKKYTIRCTTMCDLFSSRFEQWQWNMGKNDNVFLSRKYAKK